MERVNSLSSALARVGEGADSVFAGRRRSDRFVVLSLLDRPGTLAGFHLRKPSAADAAWQVHAFAVARSDDVVDGDGGDLGPDIVRTIRLGELMERAKALAATGGKASRLRRLADSHATDDVVQPFLDARLTRQSVGRVELARLALEYVTRVQNGDSHPATSLATEYPETSAGTWNNQFTKARKAGLLTDAPRRGVAGGQLTDAAWELVLGFIPKMHETTSGLLADDQLQDLINADLNERARERDRLARGDFTPEEYAKARVQGASQVELVREARRREWAYDLDTIRACRTPAELRILWLENRQEFEANPQLLAAWKAQGRTLQNPVISSPET